MILRKIAFFIGVVPEGSMYYHKVTIQVQLPARREVKARR